MKLSAVTIRRFRNYVEPQRIEAEPDVTCLVGKNESGKTTILQALHRLNPANGANLKFDLTTEYPRWRLARDRRQDENIDRVCPVEAEFSLEEGDLTALRDIIDVSLPTGTKCHAARSYANGYYIWLHCEIDGIIREVAAQASLHDDDLARLTGCQSTVDIQAQARTYSKELRDGGEALRAKAVAAVGSAIGKYEFLLNKSLDQEQRSALAKLVPRFFYFSTYQTLPGECDLNALASKLAGGAEPDSRERTVLALLAHAGEKPDDFMDDNYDSRKAELQAASSDLSRHVFQYWKQNTDLEVVFDTDNVVVAEEPTGHQRTHRILKIELRDGRHGNVETNFVTRSAGFQWFFSFFAAFSEFQHAKESIIVLLDEPGLSLHGEAQRDFLRYIFGELGASKQTLYTTHSQFMVDPGKYEKLRAVHDRATRDDPDQGVAVTRADLSADRDTILPIESALGYSISQHLLIGAGHHLAVEGSSDFVYLQRLTEYLVAQGRTGLDPRLAVIPVGGADNMPAFVALLGRRLKVSALIDGAKTTGKITRVRAAANDNAIPESSIIACSEVANDLPSNADVEDLFDPDDYLKLYNWAFNADVKVADLANTSEPIVKRLTDIHGKYDHAKPAHALTNHRGEFFQNIKPTTIQRFGSLFDRLNSTIIE